MIRAQLLNLSTVDPVWAISGLTSLTQRQSIRESILSLANNDPNAFSHAKDGSKLSLEHKNIKGSEIFNHNAVIDLSSKLLSPATISIFSQNFHKSKSNFRSFMGNSYSSLIPIDIQRWRASSSNIQCNPSWFNDPNIDSFDTVNQLMQNYSLAYNAIPFIPNMQFSIMRRGSYIPPHTDVSNKIATLIIYLPSSQQTDSLLGTTFWSPKSHHHCRQSESTFLKDSNLSIFRDNYQPIRTPFQGDNAILFFRSNSSWHSFEYDSTFDEEPRVSINVNFLFPVSSKL